MTLKLSELNNGHQHYIQNNDNVLSIMPKPTISIFHFTQ